MTHRVILLLAALIMGACATANAETSGAPEINYGRDICVECGMSIDDTRFAAAYRLDDGTEKKFDDIGGLVLHGREHGELHTAAVWVHDFQTEAWVPAAEAYFVPTLSVSSPMGHGILAFATRMEADRVAADLGGEVITWEVVAQLPATDGLLGHHHARDASMGDMNGDTDAGSHDEQTHDEQTHDEQNGHDHDE